MVDEGWIESLFTYSIVKLVIFNTPINVDLDFNVSLSWFFFGGPNHIEY